jgi:hypothetical protein
VTKSYEVRIKGVSEGLTAHERALLVLRSWKEGKEEEPAWRYTMPEAQIPAFNRLISKMNGVNRGLGLTLIAVAMEVEKLSLRLGWLCESALWAMATEQLRAYLACETKEPITEGEHRKRVEQARAEYVPVADLADALAYKHTGWEEDDADGQDEEGLIIKDKAWARLCREKERELAKLVADGVLQGKGKGGRLKVNAGSFYDWLGEETPAFPDRGIEFEVVADEQAEDVARRLRMRAEAFEELERAPSLTVFDASYWPEEMRPLVGQLPRGGIDEAVETNKGILREGIEKHWCELRAVELVVAEAEEAFGEDPCVPQVRHMLDHARERLVDAHETAQWYMGPFDLPEPSEDEVAEMRAIAERAG